MGNVSVNEAISVEADIRRSVDREAHRSFSKAVPYQRMYGLSDRSILGLGRYFKSSFGIVVGKANRVREGLRFVFWLEEFAVVIAHIIGKVYGT